MFTAFIKILPVGELPSHNHTGSTNTTGEHTHGVWTDDINSVGMAMSIACNQGISLYSIKANTTSSGNHSHTVTINNTGTDTPHNNMMPYINVYIWKRTN